MVVLEERGFMWFLQITNKCLQQKSLTLSLAACGHILFYFIIYLFILKIVIGI